MINTRAITAIFTDEEYELLEAFSAEQGIENLAEAIPAMLHELMRLYDKQWDETFAKSLDVVAKMAQEASEEYHAGLTEDFDANIP
jgi:hypothetical protein